MPNVFIGIDLAWKSECHPTGGAVLHADGNGAELVCVAAELSGLNEVEEFVADHISDSTFVAVDAPLIITNVTGTRRCEREVGQRYGARDASCHSSNQRLFPQAAGVQLAAWLSRCGFRHASDGLFARTMLEVYPHSAYVALFDLPLIIKYKKGTVAAKCTGLRIVQNTLAKLVSERAPLRTNSLLQELLSRDPATLRGAGRKSFEDALDAVFCAYLAYRFWRLEGDGAEIFGDTHSGYIVNPRLQASGWAA